MSRNIGIGEVRTKLLETDHKQWNCGMGLYDPNKVFFKEDPNGKVIVDGKLCSIVRSKSESNLVMIGGKFYKFVQIGDQIWLAENLEYLDDNIVLGNSGVSSTVAQANWYTNKQTNSYGLLYNYIAVKYIEDNNSTICPGWHVPTEAELKVIADLGYTAIRDNSWNNYPGDNSSGFTLKAAGQFNGTFSNKGLSTGLLSITTVGDLVRRLNSVNLINEMSSTTKTAQLSLRLIKDTDPVSVGGKIYKTAKIGTQIWTIENLDWIAPGMAYNVTTIPDTPAVWYYDYADSEPKEHAGALYNAYAAKYINDNNLIPGWHVACWCDYQTLLTNIGGSTNASIKLRDTSTWTTENTKATNNYRFNAIPAGNRSTTPAFVNIADYALFYTDTIDGTDAYRLNINISDNPTYGKTTAKNGLSLRLVKDTAPVTIGDKTYKTCQIGKQLWMTENLDYIFEGLNVGGAVLQSDVHAWYFNNNPAQSEGLMYNGYAASYLAEHPELLPEGWRIPTQDDLVYLQNFVTSNDGGKKLKATGTYGGVNWGGIDACHFDGKPAGIIRSNGVFDNRYNYLRFWSRYLATDTKQTFANMQSDTDTLTITSFDNNRATAISIRLVKDISTEDLPLSKGLLSIAVEDEGKEDIDEKPVEDEKKTEEVIEEKEPIKEENKR